MNAAPTPRIPAVHVPPDLEPYASTTGAPSAKACPRCLTAAAHWVTRVYAGGREVRLCVACSQAWEQRK